MTTSHLREVSKRPASACDIPTAPAFITTFQCIGQFIIDVLGQFNATGFANLGNIAVAISGVLGGASGLFTSLFFKPGVGEGGV